MNSKQKQVYQALKRQGYSDNACIGIMANIEVQTGGTFDFKTKQIGGGGGYGLFQFDSKKKQYFQWLQEKQDSAQAQIEWMTQTISGNSKNVIGYGNASKLDAILKKGSAEEITIAFCQIWEKPGKPHMEKRIKAAQDMEKKISNLKESQLKLKDSQARLNELKNLLEKLNLQLGSNFKFPFDPSLLTGNCPRCGQPWSTHG